MGKIKTFEDDSYLKVERSNSNPKNVIISICSRDSVFPDQIILLSVEMPREEFAEFAKLSILD